MTTPNDIQKARIASSLGLGKNPDIVKSDFSTKERKELSHKDEALLDGSFPIRNVQDLKDAIKTLHLSKDISRAKAWIKKRAKDLNAEDELPDDLKKAGTIEGQVTQNRETLELDSIKKGGSGSGKYDHHKEAGDKKYENYTSHDHEELAHHLSKQSDTHFSNSLGYKYNSKDHEHHVEQAEKLKKLSNTHLAMSKAKRRNEADKQRLKKSVELIEKAEGSHGGKIIGHTKSGKAIYAGANAYDNIDYTKQDHIDAFDIHSEEAKKHKGDDINSIYNHNKHSKIAETHYSKIMDRF